MTDLALIACIFAAALLHSSVGQAGASGYMAAMAIFGVAPQSMRPAALTLNVLVATIAAVRFARAGKLDWRRFWPLTLASIPFAFLGGALTLPGEYYKPLVGCLLLLAAVRLLWKQSADGSRPMPRGAGLASGACIGLLSGLTGTGGGVFLIPLLLMMDWADAKSAASLSAAFILVNSLAALLGLLVIGSFSLPSTFPWWALAAVVGGLIGSHLGSRSRDAVLRFLLSAALAAAGLKLIVA